MSSPATSKKPVRELNSITDRLLLTKTLNSLTNRAPSPATSSIKENLPEETNLAKPTDQIAALLNFYHVLSNSQNQFSSVVDSSSSFVDTHQFKPKLATKRSSSEATPMTYLCRFRQRNRLIEVPTSSEYYQQQHGISHEHLKQLIIQEFQLHQIAKATIIVQIWSDQYQEYIDIESFKQIPFEARLQVLLEKDVSSTTDSALVTSKSPSTPVSAQTISTTAHALTPNPSQSATDVNPTSTPLYHSTHAHNYVESSPQVNVKSEKIYDESLHNTSASQPYDPVTHHLMYDLLPKPSDGIPIPRFPPHIAAFLNGNGDANQLNALVQALYQEIVKYELYPNADELRSIVSRLVERYPQCVSVIGSIELLVRKLYYKFCNERKKYPVELKRRQPNKRKRLVRDDDLSANHTQSLYLEGRRENLANDSYQTWFDHLKHMWTSATSEDKDSSQVQSNSSSNSSSPVSGDQQKYHPLNLSVPVNSNNNLMCTE